MGIGGYDPRMIFKMRFFMQPSEKKHKIAIKKYRTMDHKVDYFPQICNNKLELWT